MSVAIKIGGRTCEDRPIMKRFKIPLVIVGCLIAAALVAGLFFPPTELGKLNEQWELTGSSFKIRVSRYAEKRFRLVGGAYYVFESAALGSDGWNKIMTLRHDDPDPIPRDQVRILSDQVGYAFMLNKYAVTTDSGTTWFTWDAVEGLPDWQSNHAIIKEVQLASDGTGTMIFTSVANRQAPEFHTKDYGRHWSIR